MVVVGLSSINVRVAHFQGSFDRGYTLFAAAEGAWQLLRSETLRIHALDAAAPSLTAFPNPFNPHTTLVFDLPRAQRARLSIHDVAGRRVAVLVDGLLAAGQQAFTWDGRDHAGNEVSSGHYIARLATADGISVRRLVLLR